MAAWLGRLSFMLLVGGGIWLLAPQPASLHSQTGGVSASFGDSPLQVLSALLPSGVQQLTVVDVRGRSLAVYHIDPGNGKVQLKSVRNLAWDLQMEHFNGQSPLPSELRQVQP
ncbi:MAG: hypothetical protein KDA45_09805 [Planctomycetales bacterium]|nr:hypothetical protein [Planctomycetales bacterium]